MGAAYKLWVLTNYAFVRPIVLLMHHSLMHNLLVIGRHALFSMPLQLPRGYSGVRVFPVVGVFDNMTSGHPPYQWRESTPPPRLHTGPPKQPAVPSP